MRKYIKSIELAAMILMLIGIIFSFTWDAQHAMWECGLGIALFFITFIYKAFHWQEYAAENKRNLIIVLATIVMLYLTVLTK